MDSFYSFQIKLIQQIQKINLPRLMEIISVGFKPELLLTLVLPIFGYFDTFLLGQILLAAAGSEYMSILLKWLIPEYRPFWWLRETKYYKIKQIPTIKPSRTVCEATSGFPSTHVMCITTILYILTIYGIKNYQQFSSNKKTTQIILCTINGIILVMVSISRMYLGAHFLHQCLVGAGLGVALGYALSNPKIKNLLLTMERKKAIMFASGLPLIVLTVYWTKKLFGFNPLWPISTAFNWCIDPQLVKPNNTALFGFSRDIGIIFGLAFASPISQWQNIKLDYKKSIPATVIIMILQNIIINATPMNYGYQIYHLFSFITNLIFTYGMTALIPKYCAEEIITESEEIPEETRVLFDSGTKKSKK